MLLPFFEQQARFDDINTNAPADTWRPYVSFEASIATLLCPSDGNGRGHQWATTNYAVSIGDSMWNPNAFSSESSERTVFRRVQNATTPGQRGFAFVADGTSNTVAVSEMIVSATAMSRAVKGGVASVTGVDNRHQGGGGTATKCSFAALTTGGNRTVFADGINVHGDMPDEPNATIRGGRFWDGRPRYSAFSTVMPPNSPACQQPNGNVGNPDVHMLPPQSNHPGGVNVGMFDGSGRFITDSINALTPNLPHEAAQVGSGPSEFGVWGALGSPNGGESVSMP